MGRAPPRVAVSYRPFLLMRESQGQRRDSHLAPTPAPAVAPSLAQPVPFRPSIVAGLLRELGAGSGTERVTGEEGATPSFERCARPGCARRDRSRGSLPLRPHVVHVSAQEHELDHTSCIVGVARKVGGGAAGEPELEPRRFNEASHHHAFDCAAELGTVKALRFAPTPSGRDKARGLDRASVRPMAAHACCWLTCWRRRSPRWAYPNHLRVRKEYPLRRRRCYERGTGEMRNVPRRPRRRQQCRTLERTPLGSESEALRMLVRALAREAAREAFARANEARGRDRKETIH